MLYSTISLGTPLGTHEIRTCLKHAPSSQFRTKHITKLGCQKWFVWTKSAQNPILGHNFSDKKWLELYIQTWGTRNIPYFWDVPVWVPLKMSYTRSVPSCLSSFPIWDDHISWRVYPISAPASIPPKSLEMCLKHIDLVLPHHPRHVREKVAPYRPWRKARGKLLKSGPRIYPESCIWDDVEYCRMILPKLETEMVQCWLCHIIDIHITTYEYIYICM